LFFLIILGSLVGLIIKNKIDYDYLFKPLFSPPQIYLSYCLEYNLLVIGDKLSFIK